MSKNCVRSGEPTNINAAPYITTAGVVNTSARVLDTNQGTAENRGVVWEYFRPVIIQNLDATNAVFIKINDDDASATDCHIKLLANERFLIDFVNVEMLSFFMAAGAYTTLMVYGWKP